MSDFVSLKGTKVHDTETRVRRFVFSDDSGVIVSTSTNEVDMAHSVLPDSFELLGFFNCVLQKYLIVDRMYRTRMNQWQAVTAHQSKRDEDGYDLQENIVTIVTEENCKIFGGGTIKDRVQNPNMTVYVRINNGKTISIKCDRGQCATRIMETVERWPRETLCDHR